jgi:hypothetical protein
MAGIWTIFAVFIVTLEILGFLWLNSTNARNISRGSTLLITGGVIAFAMMWGFGVSSLFIFATGVLGLTAAEIGK